MIWLNKEKIFSTEAGIEPAPLADKADALPLDDPADWIISL